MIRLQKYMAICGLGSRRKCEDLIRNGNVAVNGRTVTEMGLKIDPEKDKVTVSGRLLKPVSDKVYILLNKPRGVISSVRDQFGRKTVLDQIGWSGSRIFPVGRLDYDTEGLLILTNDGELAYKLTHPKHEIEKEYFCVVKGLLDENDLNRLRNGIDIGGFITSPATVMVEGFENNRTKVRIAIKEGKNRQVRRMFEAVGHPVIYLKRDRIGDIRLTALEPGKWRYLTDKELESLKGKKGI